MTRALLVGMIALCVAGCGGSRVRASTRLTIAPDGGRAWIATCLDAASCWEVIGKQCPNGYDIIDGDSQSVTQTDADGRVTAWTPNVTTASRSERTTTSTSLQLLVRCRSRYPLRETVVK